MFEKKELRGAAARLLAQRRETAHQELHTRMEGLYRHCPALAELEREQAALLRELTAVALKKKSGDPAALRARCAAIDAQRAHQRERLAGPVGRVAVVEVIAGRPAAGVGVDGDQGIGRSAQCVPLRGLRGPCGRKKRCGRQNRYEQVFLHSYRNQR